MPVERQLQAADPGPARHPPQRGVEMRLREHRQLGPGQSGRIEAQRIVVVAEKHRIERKLLAPAAPCPELQGTHRLHHLTAGAAGQDPHRQRIARLAGRDDRHRHIRIVLAARGHPHRTRHRGPERQVLVARPPGQRQARLRAGAAEEGVVDTQSAHRHQPPAVGGPAVLHEQAPVVHLAPRRREAAIAQGFVVVAVMSQPAAPGELVAGALGPPGLLDLQVGGAAAHLHEAGLAALLGHQQPGQLQRGAAVQPVLQRTAQVGAVIVLMGRDLLPVGRTHDLAQPGVLDPGLLDLGLQVQPGARIDAALQAQPGGGGAGGVMRLAARLSLGGGLALDLRMGTPSAGIVVEPLAGTQAQPQRAVIDRLDPGGTPAAVRRPGDDVDHAVDRIGPPDRTGRAANDLDALDLAQRHLMRLPQHAGEQGRIDAAPVDQHLQLVREAAGVAPHPDRPAPGRQPRHIHARRQPQDFLQRAHPGAGDVVAGDDKDRRGHIGQALGLAPGADHLDTHQVLERELGQRLDPGAGLRTRLQRQASPQQQRQHRQRQPGPRQRPDSRVQAESVLESRLHGGKSAGQRPVQAVLSISETLRWS